MVVFSPISNFSKRLVANYCLGDVALPNFNTCLLNNWLAFGIFISTNRIFFKTSYFSFTKFCSLKFILVKILTFLKIILLASKVQIGDVFPGFRCCNWCH
jgi:hypothetical protein